MKKYSIIIALLVILSLTLTGTSLADGHIVGAADGYFSGGTQNIAAADLFANLNDGDTSNDPLVIDLRNAADYDLAHIPGAINMSVKDLFTADGMAELSADQPIVTYCYTGQTSSQATSALNMLGYEAQSMLYGFPTWAYVEGLTGSKPFNRDVDGHDYMVSTEAAAADGTYEMPAALGDSVEAAAEGYFSNGTKNVKASAIFENLNDGDDSNDPFLIDVRRAEDYDAGHIPGAISMSAQSFFTADNLAQIPADKQIVVNCYTGQSASQVVGALNMLGYDAWNLKFGFASWSPSGVYKFDAANSPMYRWEGTGEAAAAEEAVAEEEMAEEEMAEEEATVEEAPATLPVSGGVPFDFTWAYFLVGSGLLGAGMYLRRK